MIRFIYNWFTAFGFNPRKTISGFRGIFWYFGDLSKFKRQLRKQSDFRISRLHPILFDKYDQAGIMKGHYFHQDLLIAKKIYRNNPETHVDIGSRTDGFVAHVAVYREIEVFDIRAIESKVENVLFKQADLSAEKFELQNYTDSISCLHAIEHFGLGRYGDPIDVKGHLKALDNIWKCLKPSGTFYFSTPIGPQRIEFNAHRVFSVSYLLDIFLPKYELVSFSYIDDSGDLILDQSLNDKNELDNNFGCNYGCGIFELKKK